MRSIFHKCLIIPYFLTVMILLFVLLQGQFRYLFLEIGDGHLFLWDADAWIEKIFQFGGLSLFLNGFVEQFFHIPVAGTVIASFVMTLTVLTTYMICSGQGIEPSRNSFLIPLALLPTAFLCLDVLTDAYSFQSVTDYLLVTTVLLIYCRTSGYGKINWIRLLLALLLILAAGPFIRTVHIAGSHRFVYAGWISLLLLYFSSLALSKAGDRHTLTFFFNIVAFVLSIALVLIPFHFLLGKNRNPRQEQTFQLSYYARNNQWKYISTVCRNIDMGNYMLLNYANLALSHEGKLLEHWTDYRQDDVQALCLKSDMTAGCMSLLSMIYYHVGDIAAAQDMAFEANQYQSNPYLLKMLVRTNIIFGNYKIAQKYISILEKTLFYRVWAADMKKCLSDDGVMADPEFSLKRKGLPSCDEFIVRDRMIADLMLLLDADKSNTAARDYAIVYLHLSKDATALRAFVDRFFGTEILPSLSPAMQMGLLTATGGDEQYCRSHGVLEPYIETYRRQKKEVGK